MDNATRRKTTFLITLILSALLLTGGVYIWLATASQSFTAESLSGNFGSKEGIRNIETVTEDALPGLPSETIAFDLNTSGVDTVRGLAKAGDFLAIQADVGATELVNLQATTSLSSEDSERFARFKFYASSPQDYTDGTFEEAVEDFRVISERANLFATITYQSKPTANGQRVIQLSAVYGQEGGVNERDGIQPAWEALTLQASQFVNQNRTYTLKLETPGSNKAIIEGSFHNEETFTTLTNVSEDVFNTLQVIQDTNLGLANVTYTPDINDNYAQYLLTIEGSQPEDSKEIDRWVQNMRSNLVGTGNVDIKIPGPTPVIARYENSKEAIFISYPTNRIQD